MVIPVATAWPCRTKFIAPKPAFYSPSPNLSLMSCRIAASACSASAPVASMLTEDPWPAASIITPMMLFAFTRRSLRMIQTSHWKALAVWVSLAEARACSTSLLTISARALGIAAPVRVHVHHAVGPARARLLQHPGERQVAVRQRPHQHGQVRARQPFHAAVRQQLGGYVGGRGAVHVREDEHPRAVVDARERLAPPRKERFRRVERRDADVLGALGLPAEGMRSGAQQRFAEVPVRDEEDAHHYRLESFFSSDSTNMPATSRPLWSWISRKQVGLVTLTSVSQSPITSRPIRCRPRAARTGPSACAISRWRALTGCATPRPPAARLPRDSPGLGMRARHCGTILPSIRRTRRSPSRISAM